jgi:hypothetical protein
MLPMQCSRRLRRRSSRSGLLKTIAHPLRCSSGPRRTGPIAASVGQRPSDEPVVTERVSQPSLAQSVRLVRDRRNFDRATRDRPFDQSVRICNQQVDPDGGALERLGTEIRRLWGFVGDSEASIANGHFRDNLPVGVRVPVDLLGPKRLLVEGDRPGRVLDR